RVALQRGDREGAKGQIIDSYLEGVEPVEAQLKSMDAGVVARIEDHYMGLRAALDRGETPADLNASISRTLAELTAAESRLKEGAKQTSFVSTAISSGGIVVREGVEAALLVAALLGLAAQAGHADKKRYVHAGWALAILLGVLTFLLSLRLVTISGAKRELIEGITALLATAVLFYVSYSLLAKREVQRWMRFLKEHISPRKAALSLFGVSFLAAYREAFETVLFYQALLASDASSLAAVVGAAVGAVVLVIIVAAYTRAGRFAPPQVFFRISSYLLYGLAVVFIGQGLSALQMAGVVPAHRVGLPSVPVVGFYPTLETITAQLSLLALAVGAYVWNKRSPAAGPPPRGATPAPAKG
ncbi:MAG TPA: FTR1 family protein, partial [Polyangium sp.]|nr:FTR1 family protein [Polyangium sp.]